ncbi:MAG: TIGR03118 family protein, partial [Gemmataceae bacterium]
IVDKNVGQDGRLITGGPLDKPWGVAVAPSSFGAFGNDLLVGNFGNGHINAFDPKTDQFAGELTTSSGQPFEEDHLWSLQFGNGGPAGPANTLFFTAGINGEKDGLFGSLQAAPAVPPKTPLLTNLNHFPEQTVSTGASNGDLNPYGVAFVPQDYRGGGQLAPGDLLVSNFNDSNNVQATGSTLVKIGPDGQQSTFFQGPTGLGLTTALGVLPQGFVLVGSAPAATVNGVNTVANGGLIVLDSNGNEVTELTDPSLLQGPWDLTVNNVDATHAQVFVSNVLSGTVTRLDLTIPPNGVPMVQSETQIASGYAHETNAAALVVGPTGLTFDPKRGTLYVASTGDNAIYAISHAGATKRDQGMGRLVVRDPQHLHGPLGLTLAPNGDLIVANGDAVNADPNQANELVEYKPNGKFVGQFQIDNGAPGAAFGLAVQQVGDQVRFAAVDDNTNTIDVWTFLSEGEHHGREDLLDQLFSAM